MLAVNIRSLHLHCSSIRVSRALRTVRNGTPSQKDYVNLVLEDASPQFLCSVDTSAPSTYCDSATVADAAAILPATLMTLRCDDDGGIPVILETESSRKAEALGGVRVVTNRAERRKNKAAQYLLETLVLNRTTGRWNTLLQMQSRLPQGRAAKKMRTTRSPYDVPTEDVVKFTPYSASYAARSKKHSEAAGTHLFHTAFTFDELFCSHGKHRDFYERFYSTF